MHPAFDAEGSANPPELDPMRGQAVARFCQAVACFR